MSDADDFLDWEMGRGYEQLHGTYRIDYEYEDEYRCIRRYDDIHSETIMSPRKVTERAGIESDAMYAFFECNAHDDRVYIEVDHYEDVLPEPCSCSNATDETGDCVWEFCGYQQYTNDEPLYKMLYFDTALQLHDFRFDLIDPVFAISVNPCEIFHQVGKQQALVKSARFGQKQQHATKSASKC